MTAQPVLFRHLKGHHSKITGLAFAPDNKPSLASSATDNVAKIWNFDDTTRCLRFEAHTDEINDICWSAQQNLVATASKDRTVRIFVPTIRGESEMFIAHTANVRSVDFDSKGQKLITGSNDKTIKLWKVSRKNFIASYTGHNHWVRSVRFSPNDKIIGSCADDKSVRLFDINSKDCIHTFQDRKASGNQVAWHPDGSLIAVGLQNNRIKIYDIKMNQLIQYYKINAGPINSISFHPSGNYLIVGSDDETIKIIDLHEGRQLYTVTSHQGPVTAVKFSPNGEYFASGGSDQHIMIWKTNFDSLSSGNTTESSEKSPSIHEKVAKSLNFDDMDNEDDQSIDKENDGSIHLDPRLSENYNLSEVIEELFKTNPNDQDNNELTMCQLQYDYLAKRFELLSTQVVGLQVKVSRLESKFDGK